MNTNNQDKINEMLSFLKFSFINKTDEISILFELFTDDINQISRTISIIINGPEININNIKLSKYDSQIKIKEDIFIELYSGTLSAFQLFKLMFRSNDIKTIDLSINKFRKFISKFDFSTKSWQAFYFNEE